MEKNIAEILDWPHVATRHNHTLSFLFLLCGFCCCWFSPDFLSLRSNRADFNAETELICRHKRRIEICGEWCISRYWFSASFLPFQKSRSSSMEIERKEKKGPKRLGYVSWESAAVASGRKAGVSKVKAVERDRLDLKCWVILNLKNNGHIWRLCNETVADGIKGVTRVSWLIVCLPSFMRKYLAKNNWIMKQLKKKWFSLNNVWMGCVVV